MSELNTSRHCWSWSSCFATVRYNKKKSKKKQNHQSNRQNFSNGHILKKNLQTVDENPNLLTNFDLSSDNVVPNDYNHHLISSDYNMNNQILANENDNTFINNDSIQQTIDSINSKIINQKSTSTVRSTPLDAIVEDSSEENADETDDTIQPVRFCNDCELVIDSDSLYSRLFDLSKMNHITKQLNDNGYFLDDFTRQLSKLKLKIDDIKRISTELPRDAELLEAKYSTLLATIECLSLLLKIAQISSSRSFMTRLRCSIEQRMEQLNKFIQLSSSMNMYPKRQDLVDDDLLSFRSALSSYEHLLTISS